MADRVIGLDIGSSSVKAAQVLRTGENTFVVEKQAARPLAPGSVYDGRIDQKHRSAVSGVIRKMFEEESFDTKDVVFGLNSSAGVFMQEALVPLMKPADIPKSMPMILEAKNPNLSAKENQFSYTVVEEVEDEYSERQLRVLVYSARVEYANEIAKVVTDAGLNVVGADLNALAALRAIKVSRREPGELEALIDIGNNVTVILLHHNGVPKVLTLDPDSAGMVATARIADALGLDEEEDAERVEWHKVNDDNAVGLVAQARTEYSRSLASKINSGFKSYLQRSEEFDSIANITLVGGGALLYGLGHVLRETIDNTPLSYASVDDHITGPGGTPVERHENRSGGDYLVAIGLGTGARI